MTNGFVYAEEQQALRKAVAAMTATYGKDYYLEKARAGKRTDELWQAGEQGFVGVNVPRSTAEAVAPGDLLLAGGDGRCWSAAVDDGRLPGDHRHDHL